jgi:hypothetical protein
MKVTPRIAQDIRTLVQDTTMSQTEVINSVIYQIQADVIGSRKQALMKEPGALSVIAA